MNPYPKFSKVDGSQIFTPHEYMRGMANNPKWKPFADMIQKVRDEYAPRMAERRTNYQKNKETNPWLKSPGYGYERMRQSADKMIGKTVQEAFGKFNPDAQYELISDGTKIIISPKNKVRGKDYVEVLYDVSGNYFRLQKGRYVGDKRLSFLSEKRRYLNWSGEVVNTEGARGENFHKLMDQTHWNALID